MIKTFNSSWMRQPVRDDRTEGDGKAVLQLRFIEPETVEWLFA
jgi:hypothetical protein